MGATLTDLLVSIRLDKYSVARLELMESLDLRFAAPARSCAHLVLDGAVDLVVGAGEDCVRLERGDYALLIHGTPHRLYNGTGTIEHGPPLGALELSDEPLVFRAGEGRPIAHVLSAGFGISRKTIIDEASVVPPLVVVRAAEGGLWGVGGPGPSGVARFCLNGGGSAFAVSLLHNLFVQAMRSVLSCRKNLKIEDFGLSPVNASIRLVASRLDEPWTVERMARAVGMSRSAFSAVFTTATGEPPVRFLNRMRMERAVELLGETGLPMVKVALQTGYISQAAFTRAFKRLHGRPPGEFRVRAQRSSDERSSA